MVKRLCLLAAGVLALAFLAPGLAPRKPAGHLAEKRHAVALAAEARALIGEKLLGVDYSETTTTMGYRDAKLLSAAPDFPALLVQWLREAGVGEGDAVAVNASGSFPALAVATLAAVESIKAKPLLITSLGASSWGANRPDYTWAHMEQRLRARWPAWQSLATTLGGDGDEAKGMDEDGRRTLERALALPGVRALEPRAGEDMVSSRVRLWTEANGGKLPAALVNIGGNQAFWGTEGKYAPATEGLVPPGSGGVYGEGVGKVFGKAGKPVIHLLGLKKIAARHGIANPSDANSPLWQTPLPSLPARLAALAFVPLVLAALPRLAQRRRD